MTNGTGETGHDPPAAAPAISLVKAIGRPSRPSRLIGIGFLLLGIIAVAAGFAAGIGAKLSMQATGARWPISGSPAPNRRRARCRQSIWCWANCRERLSPKGSPHPHNSRRRWRARMFIGSSPAIRRTCASQHLGIDRRRRDARQRRFLLADTAIERCGPRLLRAFPLRRRQRRLCQPAGACAVARFMELLSGTPHQRAARRVPRGGGRRGRSRLFREFLPGDQPATRRHDQDLSPRRDDAGPAPHLESSIGQKSPRNRRLHGRPRRRRQLHIARYVDGVPALVSVRPLRDIRWPLF